MDMQVYFNGPIHAWGMVQDWRGVVLRRFEIQMIGTWNDNAGTLEEHFIYDDGQTQDRLWHIKKISENLYEGHAADIVGTAIGETLGNAAKWKYTMTIPIDGKPYHVQFDDWMWMMSEDVVMNRSYMKKFGIPVGSVTIYMEKQSHI